MRLLLVMTFFIGLAAPAAAETLRAGGVGAATKLLPILFDAYNNENHTKLDVIPSLGSSGGLRALIESALDIAVAGRPLNNEEIKQGLTIAATVRTPFILVTSHPKPNGLKKAEIAEIFNTPKALWEDGSRIRIILRPKSDSDTAVWLALFPGMASALDAARARHEIPIAATDQDSADTAEHLKGSLAGSTLTQVKSEKRNLRMVPVDGVAPSLDALESGAYPFSKTLYFVLPLRKKLEAERFISFLRSPAGQVALRETGNLMVPAASGL